MLQERHWGQQSKSNTSHKNLGTQYRHLLEEQQQNEVWKTVLHFCRHFTDHWKMDEKMGKEKKEKRLKKRAGKLCSFVLKKACLEYLHPVSIWKLISEYYLLICFAYVMYHFSTWLLIHSPTVGNSCLPQGLLIMAWRSPAIQGV